MKIKYEAPKGTRIKYRFLGITTFDGAEHGRWWWNFITKKMAKRCR